MDTSELKLKQYRIPIDDERDAFLLLPGGMTEADFDYLAEVVIFFKKKKATLSQVAADGLPGVMSTTADALLVEGDTAGEQVTE